MQYSMSGSTPVMSREKGGIQVRRMDDRLDIAARLSTDGSNPTEHKELEWIIDTVML